MLRTTRLWGDGTIGKLRLVLNQRGLNGYLPLRPRDLNQPAPGAREVLEIDKARRTGNRIIWTWAEFSPNADLFLHLDPYECEEPA